MNKQHYNLSRRLSLTIMLIALPVFVLSLGIFFLQSRYLKHEETRERTHSVLNTALKRVENFMNTVKTAADANLWMLEADFRPDTIQGISNRIVRLNPNLISSSIFAVPHLFPQYGERFSVFTENKGDTVVTFCEPEYYYLDKVSYTRPVETGKDCWVYPFMEFTEGNVDYHQAIATYCKPVRQKSGRIIGVLTADFSFSRLAKMINECDLPYPHAYYILLGGDGRYLIHPDSTRLFRKTIFTDTDPAQDADVITLGHEMMEGKEGTMHVHTSSDQYHVSYCPIAGTDWSLALVSPDSELMKGYHNIRSLIIALIIISMLAILLICNRLIRRALMPIHQLLDIMGKTGDGQDETPIPITDRMGVIGDVQNSFSQMQQSLNNRIGDIRKKVENDKLHNKELEQAVKQAEETMMRKDLFMEHVALQMRAPLSTILGFANIMKENNSSGENMTNDEEKSQINDMMKSTANSMNRMVLTLFDCSESSADEELNCHREDEVSPNALGRECIQHTLSHFPKAVISMTSDLPDAARILTNHLYLMRTIRELLYNAAMYSDGKHISLHVSQTGTTVRFTVQDVGPGVPQELLDRIYKPFMKVDNLEQGLGLGLPMAKRHAFSLGGDLFLDTTYHDGCRIIIEMPK